MPPRTLQSRDLRDVRADFPVISGAEGRRVAYLDSASTAQKPRAVLDAVARLLSRDSGSPRRSLHALGERAARALEAARAKVQRLLGAREAREVIFTRSATEAINLVALGLARGRLGPGDEIVVTALEHHSNLVPWQVLRDATGAALRVAPVDDRGELDLEALERTIGPRTRLVAAAHVASATGTVLPVRRIAEMAHAHGALVLVDGALAAAHVPADVREIGCDFYALSGHKLYGPSGIGALYGRAEALEALPPLLTGGDMVRSVTFERAEYAGLPERLEAGALNLEGAVGLGAAIDYVLALGLDAVREHERGLLELAARRLEAVPGLRVLGTAREKAAVLTFTLDGVHPHDLATVLDAEGVAVRAGHLCSQPLLERLGAPAAVRASLGVYNTAEDIEALAAGIERARAVFA
ncbi:MAG: cysteine desulfurase [Planctomycetes bacterium]|nr:cysteine desulfurase [Planctomycetota bacterium]